MKGPLTFSIPHYDLMLSKIQFLGSESHRLPQPQFPAIQELHNQSINP
jgi:hypothetical protein